MTFQTSSNTESSRYKRLALSVGDHGFQGGGLQAVKISLCSLAGAAFPALERYSLTRKSSPLRPRKRQRRGLRPEENADAGLGGFLLE